MDEQKQDDRWRELAELLGLSGEGARPTEPARAAPAASAPAPPSPAIVSEPTPRQEPEEPPEDIGAEEPEPPELPEDFGTPPDADERPTAPDDDPARRGRRRRRRGRRDERDDRPRGDVERPPERAPLDADEPEEPSDEEDSEIVGESAPISLPPEDLDFSDWNVPSWQELIDSLYRPDR